MNKEEKFCQAINGKILFTYTDSIKSPLENFIHNYCLRDFTTKYKEPPFLINLEGITPEAGDTLAGLCATCNDLRGTSFRASDLYWACFRESDLENADFSYCDLRGASFNNAILKNVNFHNANLSFSNTGDGASLQGSDLTGANFEGTNLEGVKYNSKTIFPKGFIISQKMIFQKDNER